MLHGREKWRYKGMVPGESKIVFLLKLYIKNYFNVIKIKSVD